MSKKLKNNNNNNKIIIIIIIIINFVCMNAMCLFEYEKHIYFLLIAKKIKNKKACKKHMLAYASHIRKNI
jgi:hypothetical protein